jgi:hypothetical protein
MQSPQQDAEAAHEELHNIDLLKHGVARSAPTDLRTMVTVADQDRPRALTAPTPPVLLPLPPVGDAARADAVAAQLAALSAHDQALHTLETKLTQVLARAASMCVCARTLTYGTAT